MKLKTVLLFLIFLPVLFFAQGAKPDSALKKQEVSSKTLSDTSFHPNGIKKQFIVYGGFAYSSNILNIMSLIHGANPNAGLGAEGPATFKVMPNYSLGVDYGISYRTTVGLALNYVQVTGNYDSIGGTEKFTRLNISARLLYHFHKNSNRKDLYFGIRWGLSFWTDNLPPVAGPIAYPFPYTSYFSPTSPVEPSLQILLGWRRYFTYGFGIHIEAGIGSPYFLEGGLMLRLGEHKTEKQ
jgi:hypothetical protein